MSSRSILGFFLGIFIALCALVFFTVGCAEPEEDPIVLASDDTIDGIYRVHVMETLDTCSPPETEFITRWDWLLVTVQERSEENSYLADLDLADLTFHDVKVLPNSSFYFEEISYGAFVSRIYGTIDSREIYATIELPMLDYETGEEICNVVYGVEGYKLFATLPPPDDMKR